MAVHRTSNGHFLTDIMGYDHLKLYRKIYTSQNEIVATPLQHTWKTDAISIQSVVLNNLL